MTSKDIVCMQNVFLYIGEEGIGCCELTDDDEKYYNMMQDHFKERFDRLDRDEIDYSGKILDSDGETLDDLFEELTLTRRVLIEKIPLMKHTIREME